MPDRKGGIVNGYKKVKSSYRPENGTSKKLGNKLPRKRKKEAQSLAEKMITLGKTNTLHSRRQALEFITKEDVVTKLFAEIAPKYADRNGGYTRIMQTGPRRGDAAPMAILELV